MFARYSIGHLVACYLFALSCEVQGQTFWVGSTGNWNVSSNWSSGTPNGSAHAQINNGGTAQLFDPGAAADRLTLGTGIGNSGTLEVPGGKASFSTLYVGDAGTGVLSISNGGEITSAGNSVGSAAGSSGTVTVDGANSKWITFTLAAGSGAINVQNGGLLTNQATAQIGTVAGLTTVTVDGAGSKWISQNTNVFPVPFGAIGGSTANLNIRNGGSFTCLGADLGKQAGSTSMVTVEGVNSTIVSSNLTFTIGELGSGTLTIKDSGSATTPLTTIGGRAPGTAMVSGPGSQWTIGNNFQIGRANHGTLSVTEGAAVSSGLARLGAAALGVGEVTVDGEGSQWTTMDGFLYVGGLGSGTLNIRNGGSVSDSFGVLGESAGGTGAVVVDGPNSQWTNSGELSVGSVGNGTLEVRNGGAVSSMRGYLGFQAGAVGSALITDPGSAWTATGSYFIGNGGAGTFQVLNGASASTTGNSYLGFAAGSTGTATVSGTGSTWTTDATLVVGGDLNAAGGAGSLRVSDGGTVSVANGLVVRSTGTLSGDGTIVGNVIHEGEIFPGNSPGSLLIQGNYQQAPGATLELEIGGTQPGSYDKLIVEGDASFNGGIVLKLIDQFLPQAGDEFELINVEGMLANAAQVSFEGVAEGWQFSQTFDPETGNLVFTSLNNAVPLPGTGGDFDEDGDVDGDDLAAWANGFGEGTTHMDGDADADGDVDGGDFLVWQRQLGSVPAVAAAFVPEPNVAILAVAGFLAGLTLYRVGILS